jgi:hypothetical protein
MFRCFLVLFVVLFSFGFSNGRPGEDGKIDLNKEFRYVVENYGIPGLSFVQECVENNCSLDSLVNVNTETILRSYTKKLYKSKNQTKQLNDFFIVLYEYGLLMLSKNQIDFQIKITNGVIEEIKWVSDEMYEPYLYSAKNWNEYYIEYGWKQKTKENPWGVHINPYSGQRVDVGGQVIH